MKRTALTILATVAAAALIAAPGLTSTTTAKKAATVTGSPITYAVAGDSITGLPDSWWNQLQANSARSDVVSVGGYAHPGDTSAQILSNMPATPSADVLVIEVGTNDIPALVSKANIIANIDGIAAAAGAKRVLLVATPPSDITDFGATHINRQLAGASLNNAYVELAAQRGWLYADPFNVVRNTSNGYLAGKTIDGVHGTTAANTQEMQRFYIYIKQTVNGGAA